MTRVYHLTRLKLRKGTLSWHLTRLTEQKALEEDLLTDYAGERKFVHSVVIRKRLLIIKMWQLLENIFQREERFFQEEFQEAALSIREKSQ